MSVRTQRLASIAKPLRAMVLAAVLVVGTGSAIFAPQRAEASGFPTVDIAALIQRILGYVTQLQDYATQLTSTTTEISQLMQLYQDYEQTLREYEHLLNQMRSLREFISDADWNTLLAVLEPYYGDSVFAAIPAMDFEAADFRDNILDVYRQAYGAAPMTNDTFDTEVAGLPVSTTAPMAAHNEYSRELMQRQLDIEGMVSSNEHASRERFDQINRLGDKLGELGDESEVASIQFVGLQMNKMLHMVNEQMAIQNQQLSLTRTPESEKAIRRAQYLDREINRLRHLPDTNASSSTFENAY